MANGTFEVRFGEWIGEGWRMFAEQWQTWVLMSLVTFAVIAIPVLVFYFIGIAVFIGAAGASAGRGGRGGGPEEVVAVLVFYAVIFAAAIFAALIQSYFSCGLYRAAFKQLRGGKIEVRDLFSGGDCFLRSLGATILVGIIVGIGAMLCVIPGLIAQGLLFFTVPLIVDRGLGVTDAMRTSWEMGKRNILMFTLFVIVVGLIAQVGAYACGVGVLATFPLHFTMFAVAYRDCFGIPGAKSYASPPSQGAAYGSPQPPPPQPANWGYARCQVCGAVLSATGGFCSACGNRNPG